MAPSEGADSHEENCRNPEALQERPRLLPFIQAAAALTGSGWIFGGTGSAEGFARDRLDAR